MKIPLFLLSAALVVTPAWADVVLPSILSDHMVLQRSDKTRVWGKADPGEEVSVTLDTVNGKTTAGADGKWAVELDLTRSKPGPSELVVQGKNRIAVNDVVIGEVWLASGQSNMEFPMKGNWANVIDADAEIAASSNPIFRQFLVNKGTSFTPLDQCKGEWTVVGPDTTAKFTAVGYYFGKKLQRELQIPVGVINSTWGGTPVEAWTNAEALTKVPELKGSTDRQIGDFNAYPEKKEAYVTAFGQWLAENGREDKPTPDAAAFAGVGIGTAGWTKIQLPGPVAGEGLPSSGVFWLRKEIPVEAGQAGKSLNLSLGSMEGFEAIYWNGQFIKATTFKDLPGQNAGRSATIPAEQVKEGTSVVAVRIYAPVSAPKFTNGGSLRAGPLWIGGEWLAKAEQAFPALTEPQIAAAPQAPLSRPPQQYIGSALFNAMISPVVPFSIRGAIWYQGESNTGRAWQYRTAFPLMIEGWRAQWQQGDFPFYFCQLAGLGGKGGQPGENSWAELREAQSETLKLPNTGMAVLTDLGEADDIHPRNKKDVGERLAAIALAKDYGKAVPYSGPVYQSVKIENGKARVSFGSIEGGLVAQPVPATYVKKSLDNLTAPLPRNSPQSELEGFAICGEDKKWVWADAKIDGETVLVWSDQVPNPVAIRYGWSQNPTANLYNKAGFPAAPFRTDDFPAATLNVKY